LPERWSGQRVADMEGEPMRAVRRAVWLVGCVAIGVAGAAHGRTVVVNQSSPACSDENPGTAERPLKTIGRALQMAAAGDTIVVKAGRYAETVAPAKSGEEGKVIVLKAAEGEEVVVLGGMTLSGVNFFRAEGLTFVPGEEMKGRGAFVVVRNCADVELSGLRMGEDPSKDDWVYRGMDVSSCTRTTVRSSRINFVDMGVALNSCRDCVFRDLDIGPWDHEDGLRMMRCDGILVENCTIHSEEIYRPGTAHRRSGHIDGIQIIRKNDNITVRNCHIYGTAQGIGAFTDSFGEVEGWNEPRKTLRIEGNLILTYNKYQGISMYRVESPVVINNTVPHSRIEIGTATGEKGVVKNNIAAIGSISPAITDVDCNIWIESVKGETRRGPRDLVRVDPKFVNAPSFDESTDYRAVDRYTEKRLVLSDPASGRMKVGDLVEIDGDRVLRKVTAVGDDWFEFEPALPAKPAGAVRVANWREGTKEFVRDYRLREESPAVDSADATVGRGADRFGNTAYDVPGVENRGAGDPPYLDRGAFEHVPEKK